MSAPPSRSVACSASKRGALLGNEQHARGIAVQAVHELEKARLRPRRAQLLDQAVVDAAAAVDGEPRRLVDGKQRLVLVEDGQRDRACRPTPGGGRRRGAHRRNPQVVADGKPGVRPDPLAIDPDLAAAQDAVDMALGHALEHAQEEIIDALPGAALVDREVIRSILA